LLLVKLQLQILKRQIFQSAIYIFLILFFSCSGIEETGIDYPSPQITNTNNNGYPCLQIAIAWEQSDYVLPYPVGKSYYINQANCSGFGHSGFWNHGYDFTMQIGTIITASRRGTVGWARDGCADGNTACTNLITIIHTDGTVALYSHLTNGGVLVKSGDLVEAGDTIGKSGNTGNTGGFPHLHFSVHPCNDLPGLPNATDCPSLPVNFKNTDPNPAGLAARTSYEALEY
jgi:murein DD-endopeptidase MepM/ murein hydrolase activator NlpD